MGVVYVLSNILLLVVFQEQLNPVSSQGNYFMLYYFASYNENWTLSARIL